VSRRLLTAALALAACLLSIPAQAQAIDAEFRADIEKLFEVTGAASLGLQMATMASNQVIDALKQGQPDMPERAVTIVKETLTSEFVSAFAPRGELMTKLAGIYATHFTHTEVRAILAFYATDAGRKSISVMPKLAQEGGAAGQLWAQQNMPRVMGVLEQRLRDEKILK
jgi:uncharacterized protein